MTDTVSHTTSLMFSAGPVPPAGGASAVDGAAAADASAAAASAAAPGRPVSGTTATIGPRHRRGTSRLLMRRSWRPSTIEPGLRCCGCLHVRTGTVLLGLWHLTMHLLALSALLLMLFHPEVLESLEGRLPVGILVEGNGTGNQSTIIFESEDAPDRLHSDDVPPPKVMPNHGRGYSVFGGQIWKTDDINIGLMVTFCLFIITLLMLIGTVRGQPSYLMPFFCLQVFDFCISCLTLISYFSFMPDAHSLLVQWPNLPCRQQLMHLDPRWLTLLVMLTFLSVMVVKAYLIGMVWSCYRYLLMLSGGGGHPGGAAGVCTGGQATRGAILHAVARPISSGLPPDYEAALHDARFAKIDLAKYPTPPPSYDDATQAAATSAAYNVAAGATFTTVDNSAAVVVVEDTTGSAANK